MDEQLDKYFAALPANEIGSKLMEKVDAYYKRRRDAGMFSKRRAAWLAYFGLSSNGSMARSDSIQHGGQDGELSFIKVNHLRNLGQHLLNLTTSQKPTPLPIATNTDAKSQGQTILASGLLDYYSREKKVDSILRDAAEFSIVGAEGYVLTEWDPNSGDEYDRWLAPGTQQMVSKREGDLKFTRLSADDVIKDPELDDFRNATWLIVRGWENKFDLMARNPAYASEISKLRIDNDRKMRLGMSLMDRHSDMVPVYKMFHKKTSAIPEGRLIVFCSASCILFDGDLPYKNVTVRRIVPAEITGTSDGYTPLFDLLAMQEAVDALHSAVTTNLTSFGVANLWVPSGSNFGYEEVGKSMNLFKGTQKPEVIDLAPPPDKLLTYIKQLVEDMETISGVNSTVRGNPEASLKSGSALALVQSQAIQFSSGLQASYAKLVEDVYTDAIDILKEYATTKRVALIAGKFNQYMLKEFTGDDIADISRVTVESGGPLSKTASGRMQMAQDLLQNNLIRTTEEYLNVINTGKTEPLTEAQTRQLQLVRKENERLAQGMPCRAIPTDNHVLHIQEHSSVLDDPELRVAAESGDQEAAATLDAAFSHILEHNQMGGDPMLQSLIQSLGYRPIMPSAPIEQQAGGTPPAQGGQMMSPSMPGPDGMPQEPNMPTNPATGQEWNPTDGGMGEAQPPPA
jgi:hypothetical protein